MKIYYCNQKPKDELDLKRRIRKEEEMKIVNYIAINTIKRRKVKKSTKNSSK